MKAPIGIAERTAGPSDHFIIVTIQTPNAQCGTVELRLDAASGLSHINPHNMINNSSQGI